MKFKIAEIAKLLNGVVEGDGEATVDDVCKIEEGRQGKLTFLANPKYTHYIYETKATAVIVSNDFIPEKPITTNLIRVENPYACFGKLLEIYNSIYQDKKGISPQAFIHSSSTAGENCYIGEFAYIGENVTLGKGVKIYPQVYVGDNVTIGDNTVLYAGVKIYPKNIIGNNCILHAGSVIGADGFGFAPSSGNIQEKIMQIGNVIIEDNVEIGANTTIDRATLGSTVIERGAKIDNLCQIAHNVVIGENTVMAAQCGVSGSTKIGKNCMIAGQVGFAGHLQIGDKTLIGAQSGITNNVKGNQTILGSPAMDVSNMRKSYVYIRKLPEIVARIDKLEKNAKEKD